MSSVGTGRSGRGGRCVGAFRAPSSSARVPGRGGALGLAAVAAALTALAATPPTLRSQDAATGRGEGARVVVGRVLDHRGAPVSGARVGLVERPEVATASGVDGRFVLRVPSAGAGATLVASGLGYRPRRAPIAASGAVAGDTVRLDLTLERLAVGLAPVQVTATPSGRDPLAVAQSTTTLDAAALRHDGGATLASSLASLPGVAVRSDGPGASMPIVRGLTGERIVVLHDGVRASDLAATAPDHGVTIDPLAARRVEVVRGPAALLYGTNALGGVVHVLSGDVPLERPERAERGATVQGESAVPGAGLAADATIPLGRPGASTGLVLRARAGARDHGDMRLGAGAASARLGNTALDARHGALGVGWVGHTLDAGVAYRGYDFAYGLPVASAGDAPVRLDGWRHELLARVESRRAVGPLAGARLETSVQRYAHAEVVDGAPAMQLGATSATMQAIARTRPAGRLHDGAVGVLAIGRRNGVDGELALTPPHGGRLLGAFAFQELALGDPTRPRRGVRVPFGVRYDHALVAAERSDRFGPARRRTFGGVSGSAGVSVPLAAGASLGVNVARALRAPSAEELFSEAGHAGTGAFEVGDPTLRMERSTGADAVLRVDRPRLTAQLSAHANRITDWIGLYPTGRDTTAADGAGGTKQLPLFRVAQRDASLRGADASLELLVAGSARGRGVVAGLMADVIRGRDALGEALPWMPNARLGASLRYDDGRLSAGLRARHALAQRTVAAEEVPTPGYTLLDLHLSRRLTIGGHTQHLMLRVDNLTDVLWRDAASRIKSFAPGMGRNAVVGTWFRF